MTSAVWPTMYFGVPKKRAAASARRPKASSPKALGTCGTKPGFGISQTAPACCGTRARRWLLLHPPELRAALQLEPTAASRETSGTSASAAPSSRPRVRRECAPAHGEMDAKRKTEASMRRGHHREKDGCRGTHE